jgi:hypothetical protein
MPRSPEKTTNWRRLDRPHDNHALSEGLRAEQYFSGGGLPLEIADPVYVLSKSGFDGASFKDKFKSANMVPDRNGKDIDLNSFRDLSTAMKGRIFEATGLQNQVQCITVEGEEFIIATTKALEILDIDVHHAFAFQGFPEPGLSRFEFLDI